MRFYVAPESVFAGRGVIEIRDKKEIHHIRDVMRLRKGVSVDVFDGRGKGYSGRIKGMDKDLVVIEIEKERDFKSEAVFSVTLYQAIPKKGRMDVIVEKAAELGVDIIVPMVTERTVVSDIEKKSSGKVERWRRVAKAASKQCGRLKLPVISDIVGFKDALSESKKRDLVIFAALDRDARPLREILKGLNPKRIAVFVGPEGDFSPQELAMAREEGYPVCSLGQSVLRVETAAIYILSCLNYEYGV